MVFICYWGIFDGFVVYGNCDRFGGVVIKWNFKIGKGVVDFGVYIFLVVVDCDGDVGWDFD